MISYPIYDRDLRSFIMNTILKEVFKILNLRGICSQIKFMSKLVIKTKQKLCKVSRTILKTKTKNFCQLFYHPLSICWESVGKQHNESWEQEQNIIRQLRLAQKFSQWWQVEKYKWRRIFSDNTIYIFVNRHLKT